MSRQDGVHRAVSLGVRAGWLLALASCTVSPTSSPTSQLPVQSTSAGTGSSIPTVSAGTGSTLPLAGSASIPTGTGGSSSSAPVVTGTAGAAVAGTGGGGAPATGATTGTLPCAVQKALATNCLQCHGATPIGGAPMSLVTLADLQKPAATKPTLKVYELAKMRIHDTMKPMPPGGMISAADLATLDSYFGAGATAGTDADKSCTVTTPTPGGGTEDGTYGAVTAAPGETCYDMPTHNANTAGDTTPYVVTTGEHYEQFYFKAPWPKGSIATRYGTKLDNAKVIHHWLMFSTSETDAEGTHKTSPLPTLLGVNATLLAGWAVGGTNLSMPADVGFELPDTGTEINVQWHFYNSTGAETTDHSAMQVCVVAAGTRPHVATITWLGQENLGGNKWTGGAGMPPHQMSNFSGTCNPNRTGMNATDPIHIIFFWPHMHTLGINMKSVVNHKSGMAETIFDKPFDFNHQVHYPAPYELAAGDTITSTCTFNNTTDKGVPFGEDTGNEMCYQFTYAWPAHALENNAASLIGATNACW
jgi:cytochrome c553